MKEHVIVRCCLCGEVFTTEEDTIRLVSEVGGFSYEETKKDGMICEDCSDAIVENEDFEEVSEA